MPYRPEKSDLFVTNLTVTEHPLREDLRTEIETLGRLLRQPLLAVLTAVAGGPPRPARIVRAIGLDKSLASRFVRAVQTDTDLELMYVVPSPEGLRILAERAADLAGRERTQEFLDAIQRFEQLLDRIPGGRASIDAQISEESSDVRERSEHAARQAAFKSMSFLLGYYCETLATTLFCVPSANGRTVDAIEVQQRIGLRRLRPGTPLALLSFYYLPEDVTPGETISFESIHGPKRSESPEDYLLREFSTNPLPELAVMRSGPISTLVLPGDPSVHAPTQLSSAFRIRNAWSLRPDERVQDMRGYILHMPTRRLVRDLFVADELWRGATPRITYLLPGPRGDTPRPDEDGLRHYANVNLSAPIEALPAGSRPYTLPGSPQHDAIIRHVLEAAGHGKTAFRGWRSSVTYPVPMMELMWWLVHPEAPPRRK
jgi:hypothetical protein